METNILFRALKPALLAVSFYAILVSTTFAQIPFTASKEDTLSRYNQYSRVFYQIESANFSQEIVPSEKYLTVLLNGVNSELTLRTDISPAELDFRSSEEISHEAYNALESQAGNYFARKFNLWKQYQQNELYLQVDRVLRIKTRLLDESSEIERKRMFDYDLERAMNALGNGEYELAIKIFQHLLDFYGFSNVDDVQFYLGETYYEAGQLNQALNELKGLLEKYPDSDYFEPALYRCMTIVYQRGDFTELRQLYSVFEKRGEEQWQYKKDVIYFLQGSSLFQQGNFIQANNVLNKIKKDSEYFHRSKFLCAQCLHRMGKPDEALTIINSFFAVGEGLGSAILDAEALIMEGDILINRGYTNIAWGYYRLVKPESPLAARALVGQAVCRMLRGEYDSAAVIADSCLRQYPNDHYTYMARCLKADCARKLEDLSSAQEQYDIILSESANKITLADYLTEKLKIIYLLNQLREGEESILSTGDQDLFNEYWALRSETELMLKRAIYTEVIKVDSEFAGFIQEKLNVAKLMEEFTELGNDVLKIEDLALEDRYREMEDRLMDLASMVQIAGYGRLQNLPLYYTITDYEFSRAALDSLYEATTAELEGIEAELLAIGGALDKLDEEIAPGERARMMATVDKIQAWQSALDLRINRNLPKMAPSEGLDLTQWSHIAFHKTLVPGTDFNDLKEKQQRIKDIDNYIEALGKITHQMGIDLKE